MANENNALEPLLDEREVANLLKVSVATIRRRRLFRQPPDFVKIGASVRYRRDSVARLIASNEGNIVDASQPAGRRRSRELAGRGAKAGGL